MSETPVKALVVSEKCPHCTELKGELEKRGLLDKIKIIKYETPEGKKFCDDHHITAVPECVVMKKEGKEISVCSDEEFVKLIEEGT